MKRVQRMAVMVGAAVMFLTSSASAVVGAEPTSSNTHGVDDYVYALEQELTVLIPQDLANGVSPAKDYWIVKNLLQDIAMEWPRLDAKDRLETIKFLSGWFNDFATGRLPGSTAIFHGNSMSIRDLMPTFTSFAEKVDELSKEPLREVYSKEKNIKSAVTSLVNTGLSMCYSEHVFNGLPEKYNERLSDDLAGMTNPSNAPWERLLAIFQLEADGEQATQDALDHLPNAPTAHEVENAMNAVANLVPDQPSTVNGVPVVSVGQYISLQSALQALGIKSAFRKQTASFMYRNHRIQVYANSEKVQTDGHQILMSQASWGDTVFLSNHQAYYDVYVPWQFFKSVLHAQATSDASHITITL